MLLANIDKFESWQPGDDVPDDVQGSVPAGGHGAQPPPPGTYAIQTERREHVIICVS
jgi:hypothetical protein